MEQASEKKPKFEELLRQEIAEQGGIPFVRFMEQALYHPTYGYYTSDRIRIGKQGDFFTSSSVHHCFGRLIARQLEQMWQLLDQGEFIIAEQGAGEGHLALDILDSLQCDYPDFYQQVRYRIIELSDDNIERQKNNLQEHDAAGRVDWCPMDELRGMQGCFLSNELIDAFPVHLVQQVGGQLREIYVVNGADGFDEELREPSTPALADYFKRLGIDLLEGNRCEVNLAACQWVQQVAAVLDRGFVITIDYGYPADELYTPSRHAGTLLCYYQHQTNENPYQRPGCQDMTAHVDFTTLQNEGRRFGLEPVYYGRQYQFLMGLGFFEMLLALQSRESDPIKAQAVRMSLKRLILPEEGMGESFKVLIQSKGVAPQELLCERRIRDIPTSMPGLL